MLVIVVGELDLAAAPVLSSELASALAAANRDAVVDLTEVTFLDCRGVSTLFAARDKSARLGIRPRVRNATGPALRVLEMTGTAARLGRTVERAAG